MYEMCADFVGEAKIQAVDPQNGTVPFLAWVRVDPAVHVHRDAFTSREVGEALLDAYIPVKVCPEEPQRLHLYKNYFAEDIWTLYQAEGREDEFAEWKALRDGLDSWLDDLDQDGSDG